MERACLADSCTGLFAGMPAPTGSAHASEAVEHLWGLARSHRHSTEPVGAGKPANGPAQVKKVYLTDAAVARSQASNERISSLISSLSMGTWSG